MDEKKHIIIERHYYHHREPRPEPPAPRPTFNYQAHQWTTTDKIAACAAWAVFFAFLGSRKK
jgi:hypothetical protein